MKGSQNRRVYFFVGIIALLNLLQAGFTELIYDEAYYWYFSTQLAWGYFDHPPMVAGMIALGTLFFKGSLGVRLVGVIMSAATYLLIWHSTAEEKKQAFANSFIVLVFSMTLLNAYGFFSLPDTPLLFFTALLLWLLRLFYQRETWGLSMAIGLVMAALMYSKYHAVLVIVGALLGNTALLKSKKAWAAVGVSLLVFAPHLYWLYRNEFVSVAYHLFERPNRAYHFLDFGLGYFVNLMAIFGLTFPFVYQGLYLSFKSLKLSNKTPRIALMKSMFGIITTVLLFFFVSSFNRRIQTQWIVVICVPIAYLVFEILMEHEKLKKQLYWAGLANIAVIIFLRMGLVYEPWLPIAYEAHGNKAWTAALKKEVGNAKVVFENSYRNAPMYAFYTGEQSFSLNSISYRQNQYNIDQSEAQMQGERVAYITKEDLESDFSFKKSKNTQYYGQWISDFKSYGRLKTVLLTLSEGSITFSIQNPYKESISIEELRFGLAFLNPYKQFENLLPISISEPMKDHIIGALETVEVSGRYENPSNIDSAGFIKISLAHINGPFLLGGEHEKIKQWNPF